jgi:hypothetical protein
VKCLNVFQPNIAAARLQVTPPDVTIALDGRRPPVFLDSREVDSLNKMLERDNILGKVLRVVRAGKNLSCFLLNCVRRTLAASCHFAQTLRDPHPLNLPVCNAVFVEAYIPTAVPLENLP